MRATAAASIVAGGGKLCSSADCGRARVGGLPADGLIEVEFANGSRMPITGPIDPPTLTS
jgi:hypothetical protein